MSDNNAPLVLRDLQGLLRKSIGEDVVVLEYETSMLLPVGENYGSTMLKVDALIKKSNDSPEEKMYFVAKMTPTADFQRKNLRMDTSLNKEIYVIDTLSKQYRQLEIEAGVKEKDLIDIFPKYYGGRLTLQCDNDPNVNDDDAVMLLENLKVHGYDNMNRFYGMDFEHMKFAIRELARFHALGTALRIKKPELWEAAKEPINKVVFDFESNDIEKMVKGTIEILCSDPRISKYEDRVKNAILADNEFESLKKTEEIEPWISVVHGDGWVNNMLFHHAEDGKVDSVKFVDYQVSRICSPTKDIPYFLCASGNTDVMDNHFDELLDIHFTRYVEVLANTGCDVTSFTKESFMEQLNKDAKTELFHCLLVIKVITTDVPQDIDLNNMISSLMVSNGNQLYLDRACQIVFKFIEKGWI